MTNRRDFLKISSLASASFFMPRFLGNAVFDPANANGKKLIVIQLSGGNDGLNTLVPFEDDVYYNGRPGIGIAKEETLRISDFQGFNPAMEEMRDIFLNGEMCVLNSVGYPNPDRSHFRSMDIWHTGSNSDEYWNSGWLGRYLDHSCEGCAKPHEVLEIDGGLSLSMKGEEATGLALTNPKLLYNNTRNPWLDALSNQHNHSDDDLDFLYKNITESKNSAEYIHEQSKIYSSKQEYPANGFGRNLKLIAELICSGIDTSVFYVSLPGFDTHVRQTPQHKRLLTTYSQGVGALVKDLRKKGMLDNTLIMTFSEFGRRVKQNASGGTDHGKGNNVYLIGGKLKKQGIFNEAPDLAALDKGDVKWKIDFRTVYADLLKNWLGADDKAILKRSFKPLGIV
ncbi:MAG: DUF1501 domain-containing protein [Bacteroidia bacterium]|nr:DUF1501 domain-containing protein [Bacteroidia bacterium]